MLHLYTYDILTLIIIELFFKKIIEELGATGLLVVELYWVLGRPLNKMTTHLQAINDELGKILTLLTKQDERHNG